MIKKILTVLTLVLALSGIAYAATSVTGVDLSSFMMHTKQTKLADAVQGTGVQSTVNIGVATSTNCFDAYMTSATGTAAGVSETATITVYGSRYDGVAWQSLGTVSIANGTSPATSLCNTSIPYQYFYTNISAVSNTAAYPKVYVKGYHRADKSAY